MMRLFVAIRPPHEVRSALLNVMGGIRGARWQGDEQLHITLRFIGEIDQHQAVDVDAALSALSSPRFEIAINGVGAFDKKGRHNAVWAGVTPRDAIAALASKVDRACQMAGLPPEGRAYLPHITLARFARSAGPVEPFLSQYPGLSIPPFTVDHFGLFESKLGQNGASYEMIARYPLD